MPEVDAKGPSPGGALEPDGDLVVLEGGFLVERALAAGLALERVLCVPAREAWTIGLGLEPRVLPEAELSRVAGYRFHRGVLAFARRPGQAPLDRIAPEGTSPALVLAMPEIGDPENLGSAFRSAAALGASAVLLGPSGPDPLSRRALRVSMGSTLSLPWSRLRGPADLHLLADRGFAVTACVLDPDSLDLRDWAPPARLALVLGNEAFGLSAPWLEACSDRLTLEMRGAVDSLNVSTAAAIFLYEIAARGARDRASPRRRP